MKNSLAAGLSVDKAYITDAHAVWRNKDALFYESAHVPVSFVSREYSGNNKLQACVLVFAQVTFLDLAVNIIGVGPIAGAEILVNRQQDWSSRHGEPPAYSMRLRYTKDYDFVSPACTSPTRSAASDKNPSTSAASLQ